ncbi:hypothetical protein [Lawsonibacter faecis]|uniref:Uncharacterized protein n=1 Tax=Lawsonibacter faecis TaxID=2763052 RepID=A0A8J6JMK7_9FIRM|nr:hypothetical protein [Lawsonibacter faecis]MBC5738054.1 hypothetical protein [Lawsonibacter faecis]
MAKQKGGRVGQAVPRNRLWIAAVAAAVIVLAVIVWAAVQYGLPAPAAAENLMAELSSYQGAIRTVGREEYNFFSDYVKKNLPAAGSGEAQEQLTRDYINKVNAKFSLGNHLGVCSPFEFAAMELRMEQENTIRGAKADSGETVYGVTGFTLETYFRYLESTLEEDILNYLVEYADQDMLEQARVYYDAHRSSFEQLVSITYELEENGEATTETLSSAGMRTLEKGDETLAEFLYNAQPGETLDYQSPDGAPRHAALVDAVYEIPGFDDAVSAAVHAWLNVEVMDALYETVAENAPVAFDFDF